MKIKRSYKGSQTWGFQHLQQFEYSCKKIITSYKERMRLIANKDLEMERFEKLVASEKLLLDDQIKT